MKTAEIEKNMDAIKARFGVPGKLASCHMLISTAM